MDATKETGTVETDSVCILRLIERSRSMARLNFLADVIKADSEDNEPYTQDEVILTILRNAWTKRFKELKLEGEQ